MAWTDGVDRADGYVVGSTLWNQMVGATGSLMQTQHLIANVATANTTTSTTAVDLVTISSLNVPVTAGLRIIINMRKTATNNASVYFGLKINSTVVIEAATSNAWGSGSATEAQAGIAIIDIAPRSTANYLSSIIIQSGFFNAAGAAAAAPGLAKVYVGSLTALLPNAAITSIAIRALNDTLNNNAEVYSVQVLQIGY